jgi:hypothetical protein
VASSEAEVCNVALGFIGDSTVIQNMDTESSPQALALRLYFDDTRDEALRDFPWTFAKRSELLTPVEDNPNDDWDFSYRYPSDCLFVRRVWGVVRTPTLTETIKYDIGSDTTGRLIYTDEDDAEIEFTARIEDVSQWPVDFTFAFAYLLAAKISGRLLKSDPIGMGERMMRAYSMQMLKARANNENERRPDAPPESEIITSRGGD